MPYAIKHFCVFNYRANKYNNKPVINTPFKHLFLFESMDHNDIQVVTSLMNP